MLDPGKYGAQSKICPPLRLGGSVTGRVASGQIVYPLHAESSECRIARGETRRDNVAHGQSTCPNGISCCRRLPEQAFDP
jgi:hypothetical protein